MKIELFQIDTSLDIHAVKFMSLDFTVAAVGRVDPAIYYKAFSCEIDCTDLEDLFRALNVEAKPKDCFGHSLSVSDVLHVIESDHVAPGYYFCDRIGFKSISFEPKQDMNLHEALKTLQDCLHHNWKRHIVPADAVIAAVRALRALECLVEKESTCRFNQDGQCTFTEMPRDFGRWIPVEERKPDVVISSVTGKGYSEAVNVLTSGRNVITAIYNGEDFIGDAEFWEAEDEFITHWTPVLLPLPIEEVSTDA